MKSSGLVSIALGALALVTAPRADHVLEAQVQQAASETTLADSLATRVRSLADSYIFQGLARFPEIGTQLRLPIANHAAISDNSIAGLREWQALEDEWHAEVSAIDPDVIFGRSEFVIYGFLREQLESSRQSRVCQGEYWNVSQLAGWQTQYPFVATLQPVDTPELQRQALERFGKLANFIDIEIANLREGIAAGYSSPRGNVERVIEQVDGLLAPAANESPFMSMAERAESPEFTEKLTNLIADGINPALRHYRDYLANEYLPAAREQVAVAALPDGTECYRATVRGFTTLDLDPRDIHETGKQQMAKIQAEMKEIAERSFGTSDLASLLKQFKTDSQYTFRSRDEIVAYAQAAITRGQNEMSNWFGILPGASVAIEPYPEFEEKSAPGASYVPPAEDGSRGGMYRINTYQPEQQSNVGIESTAFHDAIPGHHLQLAIAQERPNAHPITRYLGNSGFTEGWGLYAERLADEMGLFSSEMDRMGLLSNEAFRAARMVVDPGIHVLGWSRQQAIDYMLEHTAMSDTEVATEVDRYIILPGQATAYMVGNLEIRSLRERAEQSLGDSFDIREFHDRVLEDGGVTLPMLRAKIERWIEAQR